MELLKIEATIMLFFFTFCASSDVDIDYQHSVAGEGTVVTDYKMIAQHDSEASGKVRGFGELINRYVFQSGNISPYFTLEDKFIFSRINATKLPSANFPKLSAPATWFRLTGTSWARNITVLGFKGHA